jgi:hypothetical protein
MPWTAAPPARAHDADAGAVRAEELGLDRVQVRCAVQVVRRELRDLAVEPPQELAGRGARGGA